MRLIILLSTQKMILVYYNLGLIFITMSISINLNIILKLTEIWEHVVTTLKKNKKTVGVRNTISQMIRQLVHKPTVYSDYLNHFI